VERVALDFGRSNQRSLDTLTLAEGKRYLEAGEFPPGSMGPKIEAAIEFVASGGRECIITSAERAADAVAGRAGTHIVAS
jgi:carbamate kinase